MKKSLLILAALVTSLLGSAQTNPFVVSMTNPYTENFQTNTQTGWTLEGNASDGYYVSCENNTYTYYTAPLTLQAGAKYEVSAYIWSKSSGGPTCSIYYSLDEKSTSTNATRISSPTINNTKARKYNTISVATTGTYYIGYVIYSPYNNPCYLSDITVTMTEAAPDDVTITMDSPYTNDFSVVNPTDLPSGWSQTAGKSQLQCVSATGSTYTTVPLNLLGGAQYKLSIDVWYTPFNTNTATLKIAYGTDKANLTNELTDGAISVTATEASTLSYDFSPEEDGQYYIGFTGTVQTRCMLYMTNLKVEMTAEPAVEVLTIPYYNAFDSTESLNGFTYSGWSYNAASNALVVALANSTLTSPAFEVEEGVQYLVSFDSWVSGGNNNTMTLKSGSSLDNLETLKELSYYDATTSIRNDVNNKLQTSVTVTGTSEGILYLSFVANPDRTNIFMNNLKIEKVPEPVELPYENAFDNADCLEGFNANGWAYNTVSNAICVMSGTGILISPEFVVEEGTQYEITFDTWVTSGNSNSMTVKAGASPETVEQIASYNYLIETSEGNVVQNESNKINASIIIEGSEEGSLYLEFDATPMARASVCLANLKISEYVAPDPAVITIESVEATDITDSAVTLTITYTTENVPEDAVITASVTVGEGAGSQEFTLAESPANVILENLQEDNSYTISVTLTASVEDETIVVSEPETVIVKTTGIDGLGTDVNSKVRYFNINGVEVTNPQSGIVIRMINGKSEKVYLTK
ncbi:MAG: hypothetical protein J1F43_01280 [Muribaculaceae bacterium]|nr:hypothetical protein [Muribaculaceae bacterium]